MATPRTKEINYVFAEAEAAACLGILASLQKVVVVVPEGIVIAVDTDQILAVLSLGPDVGTGFALVVVAAALIG